MWLFYFNVSGAGKPTADANVVPAQRSARMSKASMHAFELGRARSSTQRTDICAIVPILACVFASTVSPLLIYFNSGANTLDSRPENRLFWPAMAAISVVLALRNRSRLSGLALPPHVICLLAYLVFAGASVAWAFKPEISFIRFAQEVMIITSIVLPAMAADRTTDMMRGLFLCFAFASILNVFFVFGGPPTIATYGAAKVNIGYPGYFTGKNLLGEFAAIAFFMSLHEMFHRGIRRGLGIAGVAIAIFLLFSANSKTALGLALFAPFLAVVTLMIATTMRISPAIVLLSIPLCYLVLSTVSGFNMNRISFMLYGDSTFTGRTVIWDFAQLEIARRPLLGWGYQSFWLVGPDAPSIVEARGWVKTMPNAHNGYFDTMLEMGYVGLAFLIMFLIATLHGIGRVAQRDPARARLLLSIVLFIIIYNFLESLWMRAFDLLWVVFVIAAAEIARCWQPLRLTRAAYGSRAPRPGGPPPMRGAPRPRLRIPI
jgi:O-antigen ligase